MLESYFIRPETVDRIRESWIGSLIEGYVRWLTEHNYAARNVLRRVPILVRFGAFAAGQGANRWDELPAHVEAFIGAWLQSRNGYPSAATRRRQEATSAMQLSKCFDSHCQVTSSAVVDRARSAHLSGKRRDFSLICRTNAACAKHQSGITAISCDGSNPISTGSAASILAPSRHRSLAPL